MILVINIFRKLVFFANVKWKADIKDRTEALQRHNLIFISNATCNAMIDNTPGTTLTR